MENYKRNLWQSNTQGRERSNYLQWNIVPIVQATSHKVQQFNTSKLGMHASSNKNQLVARETKRKPLEMAQTFTVDLVIRAIKSCRNSKAFGTNKLSIFHLKHLGPRPIEYITALFNLSLTTWSDFVYMEVIINHPYTEAWQGHLPRKFISALLWPATKVIETRFLPTINKYLLPAPDHNGSRLEHSTTSALLQLTTYIAMGSNQIVRFAWLEIYRLRLPVPVCHNNMLSKINRLQVEQEHHLFFVSFYKRNTT